MIYRDGRKGPLLVKRFQTGGVTRDKEYELTKGSIGTRIFHFSVHSSEQDSNNQVIMIHLKPAMRLKKLSRPFHFAEVAIKGRAAKGNILIKHEIDRVVQAPKDISEDIIQDAQAPKTTSEQPQLPGT
jgi:topoisomerase-4 subunit A